MHGVVHDLDDWSNNYIQNDNSRGALLGSFRKAFPAIMDQLEDEKTGKSLHFIEPYDPEDLDSESAVCAKYAFVADRVITMAAGSSLPLEDSRLQTTSIPMTNTDLSTATSSNPSSSSTDSTEPLPGISPASTSPIPHRNPAALFMNVEEAMSSGPVVTPEASGALDQLRDQIAGGEKIGWWIVYNGDPERAFDADEEEDEYADEDELAEEVYDDEGTRTPTQAKQYAEFDFLNLPTPSILPPELKDVKVEKDTSTPAVTEAPRQPSKPPPTSSEKTVATNESASSSRPKRSKSFSLPLRKKSSKGNLPPPKAEKIPDPPALKEINKKEGFRHKFFGRRGDKE